MRKSIFWIISPVFSEMLTGLAILLFVPLLFLMDWAKDAEEKAIREKYKDYIPGTDARESFFEHASDFEELRQIVLAESAMVDWGRDKFGPYHLRPDGGWGIGKEVEFSTGTSTGKKWVSEPVPEHEVFANARITPQDHKRLNLLMSQHEIQSISKTWALAMDLDIDTVQRQYGRSLADSPQNEICICFQVYDPGCYWFREKERPSSIFVDYLPLGNADYSRRGRISTFEQLEGQWYLEKHYSGRRT